MKTSKFKNEVCLDFSAPNNKKKMLEAISKAESEFNKEYPLIIGNERIINDEKLFSYNPSNRAEIVGTCQKATIEQAVKAIETANETFKIWKNVPAKKRAEFLFKAASVLRKKRFEFDAWLILETGKNWAEADADLSEAIDFLNFYGMEILRYADKQPIVKYTGENNESIYIPLGVGVVIPPWNFPLAILVGMTSAAFGAGNTVVLKPSSDSPVIASKFMELLKEIKLPEGVVNLITGSGSTVGDTLVAHPKTRFISFTGSKEVGLHINELASKTVPGQIWIKRIVAEMGGKDSIIVDKECNLEAAVSGVIASTFGFQGQKCSACSRVIVDEKVYDKFVQSLIPKVNEIVVGPAKDNYRVGPVINEKAEQSILKYIEIGKTEGKVICGGEKAGEDGFYIKPTVIIDVKPDAKISLEEIFGPVLTVIKSKDFNNALEIANNTEYGLTGSVYTKNRKKIESAKKEFHVGNLYINRKCTGALVGVHPFGGFNMSGTDSKAGGRDYILLFLQAKAISEKMKN
jgi:1-pyrroline-5-carboxylate dehydrogenase